MNNEKLTDALSDSGGVTLGDLGKILKKVKISVMITVLSVTLSLLGASFAIGKYFASESTAVDLRQSFDMKITISNQNYTFKGLVLTPKVSNVDNVQLFSIDNIENEFDNKSIGEIAVPNSTASKSTGIINFLLNKYFTN